MKKNDTTLMAATTRRKTTTPKLTPQEWQKLKALLNATGGAAAFKDFLDCQDEKPSGSFDFVHGRSLPTINGPHGSVPFDELITDLSEEQSAGNYLMYGQEVWDSTSFLRKRCGLDDKHTDDNDRGNSANYNAYMGIALEVFVLMLNPQVAAQMRRAAEEVHAAISSYNHDWNEASKPKLKNAREKAARRFSGLMALIGAQLSGNTTGLDTSAKAVRAAQAAEEALSAGYDDDFFDGIDDME